MEARTPQERTEGERVHRLGLVVNGCLAVLKLVAGVAAGSPVLIADGTHSLADVVTGAVAWVSFRWASAPPDEDHHYGHGKAEAAAAFFVGVMLVIAGVGILWDAIESTAPVYDANRAVVAIGAALISLAANEWLYRRTRTVGEQLGSASLLALARDNRGDALTSVLVLVAVGAALLGQSWVEPAAAAVIGGLVTWLGWKSLKPGLDVLMDRAPDQGMRGRVTALAGGVEGVLGIDRVDVHPLGQEVRIDMQIQVDGDLPVRKGHEIAHEVERTVTREEGTVVEVHVHVNPADSHNG